jgi:NAD(P)-dependent dehydrogenase (short-subunit alcohol dehydrogenase family)
VSATPTTSRGRVFLVDDAPYVTGHILNVDGGRSAHL